MPFQIVRNDITKMHVDAIVNATDVFLSGSGSGDAAIHRAGGPKLEEECRELGFCPPGSAAVTRGYDLDCKYVFHTVGPVWGVDENSEELLKDCYSECLKLTEEYKCKSIAFPLISSGTFGCPKDTALRLALSVIQGYLLNNDIDVWLVVFDDESTDYSKRLYPDLAEYIDSKYIIDEYKETELDEYALLQDALSENILSQFDEAAQKIELKSPPSEKKSAKSGKRKKSQEEPFNSHSSAAADLTKPFAQTLEDMLNNLDESFSQMLMRIMIEKDCSNPDVYKRANIDKKLFSKILSSKDYHPSKKTCQALSIALRLPFSESQKFLSSAGYSYTHSSRFDIALEYFMNKGIYDINEINIQLFQMHLDTLGSI